MKLKDTRKKYNAYSVVLSIILYIMFLSNSGFYFHEQGGLNIAIRGICLVGLVYLNKGKLNKDILIVTALQTSVIVMSTLINGDSLIWLTTVAIDILSACFLAGYYDTDELLDVFKNLIYYLCIFSVILFLIALVQVSVFSVFPKFTQGNNEAYFTLVSFVYIPKKFIDYRNMGIFWEPGAFQVYIGMAFLLEIFSEKPRLKRLLVYSATILTTISSTGILCMGLYWVIYALNQPNKKKRFVSIGILSALLAIGIVNIQLLPREFTYALIEKMMAFMNPTSNMMTANVRQDSIIYPLQAFFGSPLIGVGRSGMSAWADTVGHRMNTCTPINWFAHYGIIIGIFIITGIYRLFRSITESLWIAIFATVAFLLSISTEPMNYNPTVIFISFLGYSNFTKRNRLPQQYC